MGDITLAKEYQHNNSQEAFNELFQRYKPRIQLLSRCASSKTGIPLQEFVSKLNFAFYKAVRDFSEERTANFGAWITTKLDQAAKDIMRRREGTYRKRVKFIEQGSDGDEDAATSRIPDDYNLEDCILNKKEADKRQLISFLLESAKIQNDPTMTAIIEEFPRYKSITALGKALGLHHEVVKRKLRGLSRYYDANRFGEVNDYLAV